MSTAFFTGKQEHFFRPLTHGDRECCAAVLRSLHDRVHGPNADYSQALTRELVLVVIQQVLADPRYRASALGVGRTVTAADERDYASELLRKLKEHGWIEDYKDPIDLKPTLKMTRAGKEVAQALSDLDNSRSRTRQRNMRSARKALAAFLASQDVDELLDAYDFASRVVHVDGRRRQRLQQQRADRGVDLGALHPLAVPALGAPHRAIVATVVGPLPSLSLVVAYAHDARTAAPAQHAALEQGDALARRGTAQVRREADRVALQRELVALELVP